MTARALHVSLLVLALFLFSVSATFLVPDVALACTCYNMLGEPVPQSPNPYCIAQCVDDLGAYALSQDNCQFAEPDCSFTSGYCLCTDASTSAFDCSAVCEDAGLESDPPAPTPAPATTTAPTSTPKKLITPTLSIDIPDVKFTDALLKTNELGETVVTSNFLADYIAGVYKYLIGIATTIAIVMIMVSGLEWTFSGGSIMGADSKASTSRAKTRIRNAVTGLVLLMSAYLILFTVNPNLLRLEMPELDIIKRKDLVAIVESAGETCKDIVGTVGKCTATTFIAPSGWNWQASLVTTVNTVATAQTVDALLVATHVQKETRGSVTYGRKIGPCGEIGVSQFMPTTFEGIVGQQCCVKAATAPRKTEATTQKARDVYAGLCDDGVVEEWPPKSSDIPNCNLEAGCRNCQVAMESCIDYFDTSKPDGLKNSITATARLIKGNLRLTKGDYAFAMCAYNGGIGGGAQAAGYAKDAGDLYQQACNASGGTIVAN